MDDKKIQQLQDLQEKLQKIENYKKFRKLEFLFPESDHAGYKDHLEFFESGSWARFRMLSGGNGSGKSYAVAFECTLHATGLYPKWWKGKVLKKPQTIWIVAESMGLFRDSMQKLLFGNPGEEEGTGFIPKEQLMKVESYTGVTGAIGRALVQHKKGHVVSIVIKTFDMRRENLQAANVDVMVFDEEPPEDVYMECVMRTRGTQTKEPGIIMLAFTPLKGLTGVVLEYMPNGQFPIDGRIPNKPDYYIKRIPWDSAPHLTEKDKAAMLSAIPVNMRDARTKGIPALGSGKVYPVYEEDIKVNYLKIAPHWPRAFGMDFGWNCTAVVWGAKDPDMNIIYLYGEYYNGHQTPAVHSLAIKQRGAWIPGICDPRGDKRAEGDGSQLLTQYRDNGLILTSGDNAIQSGIANVLGRMENGTLKICYNLENWWNEFRTYRYDKDDPTKIAREQKDHIMDATRYLLSKFDRIARSPQSVEEEEMLSKQIHPRKDSGISEITGY